MKVFLLFFIGLCVSTNLYATKKDVRWLKRSYKITYTAIQEWSVRAAPDDKDAQTAEFHKQCKAFRFLAEKWEANLGKDRSIIHLALLRWGWLDGDGFPSNQEQVDYYLVYMEYRQKE